MNIEKIKQQYELLKGKLQETEQQLGILKHEQERLLQELSAQGITETTLERTIGRSLPPHFRQKLSPIRKTAVSGEE